MTVTQVDTVQNRAVIGAVTPRGAASKQSALRAGDIVIKVFDYETPTYESAIAGIKGTAGGTLEMTMLRRPITTLFKDSMDMQLGPKRTRRALRTSGRGVTVASRRNGRNGRNVASRRNGRVTAARNGCCALSRLIAPRCGALTVDRSLVGLTAHSSG